MGRPQTLSFSVTRVPRNQYLYSGVQWSSYCTYRLSGNPLLHFVNLAFPSCPLASPKGFLAFLSLATSPSSYTSGGSLIHLACQVPLSHLQDALVIVTGISVLWDHVMFSLSLSIYPSLHFTFCSGVSLGFEDKLSTQSIISKRESLSLFSPQ